MFFLVRHFRIKLRESEEKFNILSGNYQTEKHIKIELENRIKEEVSKSRQKDHILIQQSRLASMGEMLGSIGHQWRQPLNNLSLLIQDVREAQEFNELNDQYINRFTKESMVLIKHMSRTINDFRKFYLPNKEKAVFSLSDSIEDALSIFSLTLKNFNIHVHFEYRGQQKVYGYQNEFIQVMLNIFMNAKDAFVSQNIDNRKLSIKIDEDEWFYMIEISDTGGGIETSLLDTLFDPYFTTRQNGTGLGLYMSKIILENMHGNIKAENTATGAKFLLFVPKLEAAGVQESA
jgi:C4-dicarboxylate-specific signal transduction histidine kinase